MALPYQQALARIGITLNVRSVDSSQFVTRVRSRDFDMVYTGWGECNSPGNEQLDFWGSEAADSEASRNYAGIKDPAVDAIINRIIFAKDRDEPGGGGACARPRDDGRAIRHPELYRSSPTASPTGTASAIPTSRR